MISKQLEEKIKAKAKEWYPDLDKQDFISSHTVNVLLPRNRFFEAATWALTDPEILKEADLEPNAANINSVVSALERENKILHSQLKSAKDQIKGLSKIIYDLQTQSK